MEEQRFWWNASINVKTATDLLQDFENKVSESKSQEEETTHW